MRLRLSLIDLGSARPTPQEVFVECDPGLPFAAVRPQLTKLVTPRPAVSDSDSDPAPGPVFAVGGQRLDDSAPIGQPPLLNGAIVTAGPGLSEPAAPRPGTGLVELHVTGGPGAGRRIGLPRGEHVVGRGAHCLVRLDDPGISRAHAVLVVDDSGVFLRDLEPTNRSLVDGSPVPRAGCALTVGSRLRLASTTLELRRPHSTPASVTAGDGRWRLHRRPRFATAPIVRTVAFPTPPSKADRARMPLLASFAPLVVSAALALVMKSPAMLLFALMSPVMLLGQWWSDRRHGRTSYRRQMAEYVVAKRDSLDALASAIRQEADERRCEHPDLAVVGAVAEHRDVTLWQRGTGDADDLVMRIGTGAAEPRTQATGPAPDPLGQCDDVPVVCDLAAAGVVGIAGPRPTALPLTSGLLAQLAVWHSPLRVQLMLLTTSAAPEADWGWLGRLPHLDGHGDPVVLGADLDDDAALTRRVTGLTDLVASRRAEPADATFATTWVVVLDGAHDLRAVPGVAELLEQGPSVGVHFVCVDNRVERLPSETRIQVAVADDASPQAVVTDFDGQVTGVLPDLPGAGWLERVGRALAPLEDATPVTGEAALPHQLGLVTLSAAHGIEATTAEGLLTAWASSGRPRALVGVTADGPWWVDLAADGPHALVGGTTGAGKSEMLQTLVAALAVSNRPDDLTFVLVDYKGGSAFKECARLPHVVGLVTDLDESLTARALASLGAELKRRERVLAEGGAKDLDDHLRRRATDPTLPHLGRLVIVVDEFKMLADELPDFVTGLVRLAAIGRSLGVHLVLATQRPGGIVSADMRANVALRVALRVRDRSDSDDVIESPKAATISDRMPGRAYVRTAGQRLVEVQFAHAGAAHQDGPHAGADVWALRWRDLARPAPHCDKAVRGRTSELHLVVEAARAAATTLELEPAPPPWLPPLPTALALSDLTADTIGVPLGLRDEPDRQRQDVLRWGLDDGHLGIAGGPQTGRTSALRALALGLSERHSPGDLHVHVIQGRGGSLADLRLLPHVGSVVDAADPGPARRLVARLLASARTPSRAPGGSTHTVLMVDGWEAVEEALSEIDHGAAVDELLRLARDGMAAGLRLVVTGGRAVASGRVSGQLQRRFLLAMPDPLDLSLAGVDPRRAGDPLPTGRGYELPGGHLVQLAHAGGSPDPADQVAHVQRAAGAARARFAAIPASSLPWQVRALPEQVTLHDLVVSGQASLGLGLGGDGAETIVYDPTTSGRRLVVLGPARSGRSTTLALLARQLTETGRPVVVVTPRRSRLRDVPVSEGLSLLAPGDVDAFVALRRQRPDLAILVDDADHVTGTPIETALVEATTLVETADGLVVVAADLHRAAALFRGLVPDVARDGTGILLSPSSPGDGDLLRARIDLPRERRPGLGVFVTGGESVCLQVADVFASTQPAPSVPGDVRTLPSSQPSEDAGVVVAVTPETRLLQH